MAEGSNGRRRFSDKWGKHELDVLAVLSSAFPQWLTSRQIAQRVKAYADSYGELADQAAKAAFAKQFQRDRAKLAAMGIAIESRQPEYSSKSEGQDFASYRLQLGDEPRIRLRFAQEDLPILAAANYLARSMSISSAPSQQQVQQHASRTAPRVPQTPIPGLGLDSIAPGLGTQAIPDALVKVIDSRRFAATVDVDGELLNVAYTDSDDLAMFVLQHPGAAIVSPQEAVDAFHRRLNAASQFQLADESASPASATVVSPSISRQSEDDEEDPEEMAAHQKKNASFQTGSEVDRRLRLMLFLSAHLGEEFSLEELAERFIGKPKNNDERRKHVATIHKDINTLTTVSDDGEMAGSQFFDIDWSLLDAEGIVSATNSLGLERLAGISPQYLSMLTASVSYPGAFAAAAGGAACQGRLVEQAAASACGARRDPVAEPDRLRGGAPQFLGSQAGDLHRLAAGYGIHRRRRPYAPQAGSPGQDLRGRGRVLYGRVDRRGRCRAEGQAQVRQEGHDHQQGHW